MKPLYKLARIAAIAATAWTGAGHAQQTPSENSHWAGYTYPQLGLSVSLSHDQRPRYERFIQIHTGIDRLDALEYLALNPESCTLRRPCQFTTASRADIRRAFNTYHHADPQPTGVRWSVRDKDRVPREFFDRPTTTTVTTIIYETTVHTTIYTEHAHETVQELIARAGRAVGERARADAMNLRVDTVFVAGPSDTVYVRRPAHTDTVFVPERLPQDTLLLERSGRRYTFPGATVVCYEEPRRECVRIPGRE